MNLSLLFLKLYKLKYVNKQRKLKIIHTGNVKRIGRLGFLLLYMLLAQSCSDAWEFIRQLNIREPVVKIEQVEITGLNLHSVYLAVHVSVENPNGMDIHLNTLDYDLLINARSFLRGKKTDPVDIKAHASEPVTIPLSLTYKEIRALYSDLRNLDTIPYQLNLKIGFNLPVLGTVEIPATRKGSFPNLRMPTVRIQGIKLQNLSFTNGEIMINLAITNPNAFNLTTNHFKYSLEVNGLQWINGELNQTIRFSKKSTQKVPVLISLNFMTLGAGVYQLLTGHSDLHYRLKGQTVINSSLNFLNSFNLPFDKTGQIKLTK